MSGLESRGGAVRLCPFPEYSDTAKRGLHEVHSRFVLRHDDRRARRRHHRILPQASAGTTGGRSPRGLSSATCDCNAPTPARPPEDEDLSTPLTLAGLEMELPDYFCWASRRPRPAPKGTPSGLLVRRTGLDATRPFRRAERRVFCGRSKPYAPVTTGSQGSLPACYSATGSGESARRPPVTNPVFVARELHGVRNGSGSFCWTSASAMP